MFGLYYSIQKKKTLACIETYLVTTIYLHFTGIVSFNTVNDPYRWILFLLLDITDDECGV